MSNVKASTGVVAKMKEVTLRTSVSPCPVFSIFQHPVLELKEAKAKLQRGNIHLWKVNLHRKVVPQYLLLSKTIESSELQGTSAGDLVQLPGSEQGQHN